MEIILLQDVEKVGLRGDVVNVADGFARNFLIPRRYAERATTAKVAELQKREEQRARQEARTVEQAQEIADRLSTAELRFDVPAGPTGRLFGSVTPTNLADELWRTLKVRVDRRKIGLPEPLKRIGRYQVPVEVFDDVVVEVKTLVVPEGGELPPEEVLAAMEADERAEQEAAAEAEREQAAEQEVVLEAALAEAPEEAEAAEEEAEQADEAEEPAAEVAEGESEVAAEPGTEPDSEQQ
jgi:large subunit ribosomal protein L9